MLNLVLIKTFLGLIDHRSFQITAEHLGLAQPTVSLHIQKLEEQLGLLLFRRGRGGCEPTAHAWRLLPFAQGLMRLNQRALDSVHSGKLRVGASSNVGIYLLPPLIRRFLDADGNARLDLVIDDNPAIADQLENGELDIGVMEWWDGRAGFRSTCWRREKIVVIVPPQHVWAQRHSLLKSELAGIALLGGEAGTGTGALLRQFFGDGENGLQVSMRLGSTEAVKQAVKAGLGISMVMESTVISEVANGSLRAIPVDEPGLRKDLQVVWRDSGVSHLPQPSFAAHLQAQMSAPANDRARG